MLPLFDFIDFEDVIGNILVQDNALKLMHEHEKILKAIFAHYCSQVHPLRVPPVLTPPACPH